MKIKQVLNNIFTVCMAISIFGGFMVFVIHVAGLLAGLVAGAEQGATIMVFASDKITKFLIRASSIGVVVGMAMLYVTGQHALTYTKGEN